MNSNRSIDLDWLFYGRVYIWSPKKVKENRLFIYLKLLFQIAFSVLIKRKSKQYSGGLFFIDNSRHYDQARLIIPCLKNVNYHSNYSGIINGGCKVNLVDNIHYNYRRLIKYIPEFFSNEINKKSIIQRNNLALTIYGVLLYENYKDFFKNNNIDYVVIFTDHTYKNRALKFAAKECGVPTVYIPHASISLKFPPLEFDLAFLEGLDMQEKYQKISDNFSISLNSEIILTGNIKINEFKRRIKSNQQLKTFIGIAFNPMDSLSKVENLIKELYSDTYFASYKILIRPHPSVKVKFEKFDDRISISSAKEENSLDFLNKIDFLISGDSNIVLESLLISKPTFMMPFMESFQDNYSFIAKGLCPFLENTQELKSYIDSNFSSFKFNSEELSYYDYSYQKEMNSIQVIYNRLNKFIQS